MAGRRDTSRVTDSMTFCTADQQICELPESITLQNTPDVEHCAHGIIISDSLQQKHSLKRMLTSYRSQEK